jgi:hypothetical protein
MRPSAQLCLTLPRLAAAALPPPPLVLLLLPSLPRAGQPPAPASCTHVVRLPPLCWALPLPLLLQLLPPPATEPGAPVPPPLLRAVLERCVRGLPCSSSIHAWPPAAALLSSVAGPNRVQVGGALLPGSCCCTHCSVSMNNTVRRDPPLALDAAEPATSPLPAQGVPLLLVLVSVPSFSASSGAAAPLSAAMH